MPLVWLAVQRLLRRPHQAARLSFAGTAMPNMKLFQLLLAERVIRIVHGVEVDQIENGADLARAVFPIAIDRFRGPGKTQTWSYESSHMRVCLWQ